MGDLKSGVGEIQQSLAFESNSFIANLAAVIFLVTMGLLLFRKHIGQAWLYVVLFIISVPVFASISGLALAFFATRSPWVCAHVP